MINKNDKSKNVLSIQSVLRFYFLSKVICTCTVYTHVKKKAYTNNLQIFLTKSFLYNSLLLSYSYPITVMCGVVLLLFM